VSFNQETSIPGWKNLTLTSMQAVWSRWMKSSTTRDFWAAYRALPQNVREVARNNCLTQRARSDETGIIFVSVVSVVW